MELDAIVRKAAEKKAKDDAKKGIVSEGPSLKPASETGVLEISQTANVKIDDSKVFANLSAGDLDDEDDN